MSAEASYSERELANARELHDRIVSFDSHVDLPPGFKDSNLAISEQWVGQFDLERAARGHLSGAALVLQGPSVQPSAENLAQAREQLEAGYVAILRLVDSFRDRVGIAHNPDEFRRLAAEGRFAIVLAFQNAAALEDLESIEKWIARGVALFAFTFVGNNQWADSARPFPFFSGGHDSGGLSALGKAAIGLLNDRGAIVDVTQLSSAALADALATTRSPVVASHSAVRSIVDVDRNLSDNELRAVRENGGVVQIVGFSSYLRATSDEKQARIREAWRRYGLDGPVTLAESYSINHPGTRDWSEKQFWAFVHEFHAIADHDNPEATLGDLLNAIDHAVLVAGIDHVGISSDFNHGGGLVGWRDVGDNLNLTAALIRRGYAESDIGKLWGGNFLRVWQSVFDRQY